MKVIAGRAVLNREESAYHCAGIITQGIPFAKISCGLLSNSVRIRFYTLVNLDDNQVSK
jgi:deoxyribose-phosphate aldolase